MMELKKQYIVNEDNQIVAVQLDIATFEQIENIMENYALAQLIKDDESGVMTIEDAKKYYVTLDKA